MATSETLIDIGANLSHPAFKHDVRQVVEYARKHAGVERALLTTAYLKKHDALRNFQLCDEHRGFRCTLGIHPHRAAEEFDVTNPGKFRSEMCRLLKQGGDRVAAIGETGLDYFRMRAPKDAQMACFEAHVALACELRLPLFLHERDAHEDFLGVLDKFKGVDGKLPVEAVVHCFTGTAAAAREYVARGFYVGITGFVGMHKRGRELRKTVLGAGIVPLERLMVETDCPYMTPDGDGVSSKLVDPKRNEPVSLADTVTVIARELPGGNVSFEDVARETTNNASRVFFRTACIKGDTVPYSSTDMPATREI